MGGHPGNVSPQNKMLKHHAANPACTAGTAHTEPQQLPGTVIWMMFSSSGSILICLIPPSSPEVPVEKGNGRQSPTGSSNATSAQHSNDAGKTSPASISVPAGLATTRRLQTSGPAALSTWHAGNQRDTSGKGFCKQLGWQELLVPLNWQLDLVQCSFPGFLHLK